MSASFDDASSPPHVELARRRTQVEQREFERNEVAAHYEHQPEIFARVLDSRLAYSTGIYLSDGDDLETAQEHKFSYIAELLSVKPGEQVLDAGCGWGSVLVELGKRTQGQLRGITLSEQQAQLARRRAVEAGVDDRVQIDVTHVEDLELEPESLDVVLFVGSIVHMHNRPEIHQKMARALRPGGRLFINDCYFPGTQRGRRDSEATRYILSTTLGYCRLLSLSEELALIESAGFDVVSVRDLTSSYVRTVGHWIDNIRRNRDEIEALSPRFGHRLQCYMTVGRLSFARRTALEYMILATKGPA
jgi:cyclopropane-fatty-acyl-phospholipid synthase